jgi:DNA-binding transcriptional ArsR family regulator
MNNDHLDATLTALADPTRRAILRRLMVGDARVTQIAQPFSISLNSVSKHIRMLERAHLVQRRREGREHVLSFNATPLDGVGKWIEAQRRIWSARLERLMPRWQPTTRGPANRGGGDHEYEFADPLA